MTIAIQTRYLGPTNYRSARIVAEPMGNFGDERRPRVYKPFEYLPGNSDHVEAAKMLIEKMGWTGGQWHAGDTETGYVFVKSPAGEFTFETERRA